jgi:hypothetical protein
VDRDITDSVLDGIYLTIHDAIESAANINQGNPKGVYTEKQQPDDKNSSNVSADRQQSLGLPSDAPNS